MPFLCHQHISAWSQDGERPGWEHTTIFFGAYEQRRLLGFFCKQAGNVSSTLVSLPSSIAASPFPTAKAPALLCKALQELCPAHGWLLPCSLREGSQRSPPDTAQPLHLEWAGEGQHCTGVKVSGLRYISFVSWCLLLPMKSLPWGSPPSSLGPSAARLMHPVEGSAHPGKVTPSIMASLLTADSVIIWVLLIAN